MILTCAFSPDIAGGLFHFKKDHAQYSLEPEDYANKPLFLASKDEQYTATLERLEVIGDEAFKLYVTRKIQGRFRRWGCPRTSDAAASPAFGTAPGGAGASTQARPPPPTPAAPPAGRRPRRPRWRWGFVAGERHGTCAVGRRGWC